MPYNTISELPPTFGKLPDEAKRIAMAVVNDCLESGDAEESAIMQAWGAVKRSYEQDSAGEWAKKASDTIHYMADVPVMPENLNVPAQSEIQIMRTGTFHHPLYGKFSITDETFKTMVANFGVVRPKAPTELVVDYDHLAADPQTPDSGKAAGWFKKLRAEPGKLFATVEWTKEAAKAIKDRLFRFISPEFNLNYKDKESGKSVGPTIISAALTNRPFLEGMQPVVLSEELGSMLFSEEVAAAEWDVAYINNLPDGCFAYVKPGGSKDAEGKTVPRDNRMLPYKGPDSKVDLPHLRNALARLDQTDMTPEQKNRARGVLEAAASSAGVGDNGPPDNESKEQEETVKLHEILGIKETDSIEDAVKALKDKSTADATALIGASAKLLTETARADAAELKLLTTEVTGVIEGAIRARKILPRQKAWAMTYALRDLPGFQAFIADQPEVGPDVTVKGHENDMEGGKVLSEAEKTIAKNLRIKEEDYLAAKNAGK